MVSTSSVSVHTNKVARLASKQAGQQVSKRYRTPLGCQAATMSTQPSFCSAVYSMHMMRAAHKTDSVLKCTGNDQQSANSQPAPAMLSSQQINRLLPKGSQYTCIQCFAGNGGHETSSQGRCSVDICTWIAPNKSSIERTLHTIHANAACLPACLLCQHVCQPVMCRSPLEW